MVLSVKEQITDLEEQLENTKGPGSKAKKAEINRQLDALKTLKEPVDVDSDELVPDEKPIPKDYVKVSWEEIKTAEKNGTLYGFDPDKMIALIR